MMDRELIRRARKASLEEYLKNKGEILKKEGRQYRVKSHPGLVVFKNMWYSHTLLKGGNSLDYLVELEGMEFRKAVVILSQNFVSLCNDPFIKPDRVVIPPRNENNRRVLAYLVKARGISAKLILPLLKEGRIYEAAITHNAVFTGTDNDNTIRYVMQRSTLPGNSMKFESKGSDKKYSFSIKGKSNTLFVFESPIDLLSFVSLKPGIMHDNPHMLSLGGVSDIALKAYIQRTPAIHSIVFCLDHDQAGFDAYLKFHDKYTAKGFHVFKWFSEEKDWNRQLLKDIGAL